MQKVTVLVGDVQLLKEYNLKLKSELVLLNSVWSTCPKKLTVTSDTTPSWLGVVNENLLPPVSEPANRLNYSSAVASVPVMSKAATVVTTSLLLLFLRSLYNLF